MLLQAFLRGEQPPLPADPLSEMITEASIRVRQHKMFDREISRYWETVYFQRELASSPHRQYEATLAMWIKQVGGDI